MKKTLICTAIATSILSSALFSLPANATTLNNTDNTINQIKQVNAVNDSGFITATADSKIEVEKLPENVDTSNWKSFKSEKEAKEYFNSLTKNLVNDVNSSSLRRQTTCFAYNGYRQAQQNVGFVTAYMTVPYTAKWSSSKRRNYYSSCKTPSSGITGFTWQNSWEQISGASNIEKGGSILTGVVTGKFKTHLITNGLPAVYSRQVTLRGRWGNP